MSNTKLNYSRIITSYMYKVKYKAMMPIIKLFARITVQCSKERRSFFDKN